MVSRTFGDLAQGAVAKYLKQAISYEDAVLADTDPENLHQMRVGLRRLRTALQVFAVGICLPKAGREPKVAKLGRKLGKLRDLDVIEATLRDRFLPDLPETEQQWLMAVLDQLDHQRRRSFKAVKKLLNGKPYDRTVSALNDWLSDPAYSALGDLPATDVVPDLVLPLLSQLWLHPGWLVGTKRNRNGPKVNPRLSQAKTDALIADQGGLLHSLRKQVKRVRYQLRVVAALYGDALEADLERLSAMQDTLGQLQDSVVLEDFMTDSLPSAKDQLPTLFALLAHSRHQAWKDWQTHQQHYLNPAERQRLRLLLLHPGERLAPLAAELSAPSNGTLTAAGKPPQGKPPQS